MSGPQIPIRREGSHHDTVSMRCMDDEATAAFNLATERLYAINRWRALNDKIHTDFLHCDAEGIPVDRHPQLGDTVRIDLPGPGSPRGGGYDWVRISELGEHDTPVPCVYLRLTPCPKPGTFDGPAAHFYASAATNTLILRRVQNCLLAEVHGRNEIANVSDGSLLDRVRNEAVAVLGQVGLGKIQWQDWTDGLVSVVEP